MKIEINKSLKEFNTFGIDCICNKLITIEDKSELNELGNLIDDDIYVIGGGSNLLLPDKTNKTFILLSNKGINIIDNDNSVLVQVSAGENWHQFVKFTVENSFFGLENLALIPGKVGAAPIQNIGAYGIEQDSVFIELEAFNIKEAKFVTFKKEDCKFGYRDSIFKRGLINQYIVTSVTYKLNKLFSPILSYAELKNYLFDKKLDINQKNIFDSVICIRESKLPNPKITGNAGSFFKNPLIPINNFNKLKKIYSDIKGFKLEDNYKISAGWLIEKANLKGYIHKSAAVSNKHALVLINYNNAKSSDVKELVNIIKEKVFNKFSIMLEEEVNIIE